MHRVEWKRAPGSLEENQGPVQAACKPGSVPADSKPVQSFLWEWSHPHPLAAYPRRLHRSGPSSPPIWPCSRGVFRAASVTTDAVGSYPTFSPLPRHMPAGAVCFLWHFPSRPRTPCPGITWRVAHGARTFLVDSRVANHATARPPHHSQYRRASAERQRAAAGDSASCTTNREWGGAAAGWPPPTERPADGIE